MSYYKRNLFAKVVTNISSAEAIFVFGARQCGKTTLLKQLMQYVGIENSIYIDIEFPQMLSLFNGGIEEILKYLRYSRKKQNERCYVFIDEIQYVDDFSKTVKLMVDHYSEEFKLVMTGSSSALIKYHFRESLVGRKFVYELYPLSFDEFLRFKEMDKLAEFIVENSEAIPRDKYVTLQSMSEEFMIFGSYPKVALSDSREKKREILTDIIASYILKDLKDLFHIEKTDNLNRLVRILAVNIGNEINVSSLANETGLHRETVQNYLDILAECYVIKRLKPYYKNISTELRKTPKVYFVDSGIRNMLVNNLNELNLRTDRGELFENFVFLNLFHTKPALSEVKFWKTRNKQEIDFVVENAAKLTTYEAKISGSKTGSFRAFAAAYPESENYTVCFSNADRGKGHKYAWELLSKHP